MAVIARTVSWGGQHIHCQIHRRLWVVFDDREQALSQCRRIPIPQKMDNCIAEGIIHHRVQSAAQQIGAVRAIADLVGRILPDLSDQQLILAVPLDRLSDQPDKAVRQLVSDIQPESRRPELDPVVNDAILPTDELLKAGLILIDLRQAGKSPPAAVAIGRTEGQSHTTGDRGCADCDMPRSTRTAPPGQNRCCPTRCG